ncbi:MAG TPA: putative porin, partial [Cyclobacteriaceae bacterium]
IWYGVQSKMQMRSRNQRMSSLSLPVPTRSPLFIISLIFVVSNGLAQRGGSKVVDDSTRNTYGPNTSKWITEEDLFYNRNNYQPIDTSIINYHRWTYLQRFNNEYKDLGNVGSALYPIFPSLSGSIGVSTGFNAFDPYFDTEEPNYFDTKSPYTRMKIIWGGDGRAMTRIEFSRNINPQWNFGFNYRPLLVDRQVQRLGKGQPRQTISHYYDAYSAYKSKNDKYHFLINYRRIRHNSLELGGIEIVETATDSTYRSLFDDNTSPKLNNANSIQLQNQVHVFNEYKVGKALQLYHKLDLGKKVNTYKEDLGLDPISFYDYRTSPTLLDPTEKDTVRTTDSTRFSFFTNELGIKGKIGRAFYNGYVKTRSYHFSYKYLTEDTLSIPLKDVEYYIGGRLSYEHDSLTHLTAWLEYLDGGNYGAEVTLKSKWLDAKAVQLQSRPSFIHNSYRGNFAVWNNDFKNIGSTQIEAFGKFWFGRLFISPGFTFTTYRDYIFFKKDTTNASTRSVLPFQSSGKQKLFSPELQMDIRFFRSMHLKPQVIYSSLLANDDEAIRVPELFVNTQLTFENSLFNNHLDVQIGVDFHWKSSYFDLAYDPAIQQFYTQEDVSTPSFPLTDIFFNGRMKRGRFFIKYNNIVQAFTKSGYLPTPVYPGQRNILDFGFELLLFD